MDTDTITTESTAPTDIPGLVAQARAAYQQTRIKECLALTKALLLIDPGNAPALQLQSAIRADMQRDLSDARALFEESRNSPQSQKYRKAAEIILLKTLYLDPENEGAKTLLSSVRALTETRTVTASPVMAAAEPAVVETPAPIVTAVPEATTAPEVIVEAIVAPLDIPPVVVAPMAVEPPAPIATPAPAKTVEPATSAAPIVIAAPIAAAASASAPVRSEMPMPEYVTQPQRDFHDAIPFTTGVSRSEKSAKKDTRSNFTVPIVVVAIVVLGGGLLLARQRFGSAPVAAAAAAAAPALPDAPHQASASGSNGYPLSAPNAPTLPANLTANVPVTAGPSNASPAKPGSNGSDAAVPTLTPLPAPAANTRGQANAIAMGSLAVSSPLGAEIYMGDKYLGSTPTTLQLPAGNQTIEYRHGDLRTTLTHVVKANDTTTALVTFDVVVQLNAKPWANVFLDGPSRLLLGQTPLSNVKLPVGSVLVFENPNFPSKNHKIAIDDKTIQIVFQ